MTAPTPEQMRALADKMWIDSSQHRPVWPLEHSLRRTATALRSAADHMECMEAAIESAPHEGANNRHICASLWRYPDQEPDPCDCWKAGAQ